MRLSRRLKKRIIKAFGRGTYYGIVNGYLTLEKYSTNSGVTVCYTDKQLGNIVGKTWFHAGQFNPYINFPTIKF